ncbi:MAG: DNA primase [Chloroflexota bacterium]
MATISEEIKSRLDIVDIVGEYLPLRKSGRSYTGFCPFHPNTRTPSFVVFPDSQTWRCFGACAEGGDLFSFVMKKEGWDFKEALVHLAGRAGVTLEERRPADKAQQAVEDRLGDLLTTAADYFHQLLLYAPQAEHARRYLAGRQLTEETIATFKLGYALNQWDAGRSHFTMQGFSQDDLMAAGLLIHNEDTDSRYDRFRHRLMIPIRDVNGRVVGFGARTLDPDGLPKYLNSPQTPVFDKGRLLYGLDLAKRHVRESHQAVIVEGYMDVMQAWQAGYRNVVAQMGTALTESQLRLLKRFTKAFVLALDADAAGAKATLRSLEVARETLDREADTGFDARGLVRHESRLEADIRVVTLPEGHDPDKLIRNEPAAWLPLLKQAKPVVEYVIGVVTSNLDLNDAKAKSAAAHQILPLIADVADPVEREHYRQQLARALRVDERALRLTAGERRRPADDRQPLADNPSKIQNPKSKIQNGSRQANYLRQCFSYPQLVTQVDQRLLRSQQPVVTEADFATAEDKLILRHLRAQLNRQTIASSEEMWDSLDESLAGRVQYLLSLSKASEAELERLPDTLVLSILDWRYERVKGLVEDVRRLSQEAQGQGDAETIDLCRQQTRQLSQTLAALDRARGALRGFKVKG